jgi:hypothetical protein
MGPESLQSSEPPAHDAWLSMMAATPREVKYATSMSMACW